MMIVFVYDTARCCKEEDDPADAVVYFHPAWVSPTQRLALAGQLMGVNQFLCTCFSPPSLISLQGGKFVLKRFGSYILAVGTDRNIQDWILERRANVLESLFKFFHCNFETISSSVNSDRNKFVEKLYQMFEIYLPILQYSASLFSNLPMLKLPRSASNVFLEAMQILQYCQETNGIIGGALFYNNKIVASQLNAVMTKLLVITDPYRIKAPADRIPTDFHLPVGVQLLRVFVEQREFLKLSQEANMERGYGSTVDTTSKKSIPKKTISKSNTKEQSTSMMKRDASRIFTVPEDVELDATHYNSVYNVPPLYPTAYSSPIKKKEENEQKNEKPKYQHPLTPSVCSTPLKDVNRVLHGFAVSICATTEEENVEGADNEQAEKSDKNKQEGHDKEQNPDEIPDVVKEALRCKRLNKLKTVTPKEQLLLKTKDRNSISLSLTNLEDSVEKDSNRVPLRAYNLGLPRLNALCVDPDAESPKAQKKRLRYTITDPLYPVFRSDGTLISQSLHDEYISDHYKEFYQDVKTSDFNVEATKKLPPSGKENLALNINNTKKKDNDQSSIKSKMTLDVRIENKSKQENYRRSMSLPLKPMSTLDDEDRRKSTSESSGGIFDLPQRRKLDGLQLTPLMSKLSILADERTSGFCSGQTTPSEFRDLSSYSVISNQVIKNKLETLNKDGCSDNDDEIEEDWTANIKDEGVYEKSELFLCGHGNMVLFLLMEDGTANDPDLIHALWETCVSILGRLEMRLQECLEPLPSNESKELYSVLSLDSDWDTVHRSGLWGVTELDVVSSLHNKFKRNRNVTDIIVRTDDSVVYGNQCGNIQVFYQQATASASTGGLPAPADMMGTVPLRAKRRLERDHGIIIL
ncbi:hypothetical protein QAD02_016319 [Eretmocerus hayati]|uniref:Uncharacterized protein n=1 Tax=Eretmocerus hayati TaxID=131215 RepID=A0ACC2PDK5_9HYME|nr:hypothetical protein QAD02_016319 [Eretmocerus hayati]